MPSPFPGMDPYLEAPFIWSDFHLTMTVALRGELNHRLPSRYAASVDRYVWIHEPDALTRTRAVKPDVVVADRARATGGTTGVSSLAAPATVTLPVVQREGNKYLKIVDLQSRRVVTVVEILSPSNKEAGPDREAYLTKRVEYLSAGVNLVEIDLLRAGQRLPFGDPPPPPADYYVLVCRAAELPQAGVWPISVRDPLPTAPIPLDPGVDDVPLPLKACLDRAYDEGRYAQEIDYTVPPVPPLDEPTAVWARDLSAKTVRHTTVR